VNVQKEPFRGERPFVLRVLIQGHEHARPVLHPAEVRLLVLDIPLGIEREPVVGPRDLLSHLRIEPHLQLGLGRDWNRPDRQQCQAKDQHPNQPRGWHSGLSSAGLDETGTVSPAYAPGARCRVPFSTPLAQRWLYRCDHRMTLAATYPVLGRNPVKLASGLAGRQSSPSLSSAVSPCLSESMLILSR